MTGERGESGERGVQGERGVRGDHGQHGDQGERGDPGKVGHGERGDTGGQGIAGERGKQGDSGKCGDRGEKGEKGAAGDPGPPPITRRLATILAIVLTFGYMGIAWVSERHSCQRQDGVRDAARLVSQTTKDARLVDAARAEKEGDNISAVRYRKLAVRYERAAADARQLDCSGIFLDK